MKIVGALIAAAAVVSVSSSPWSSYDYYGGSGSSSYSSGFGSPSNYYNDYYIEPSSSYGYGSSSNYYDDYYSESSSPYGHGSSSNYYDDYSSGYGSSSKYDDYYSEFSSPYGHGSSSNYYYDYSSGYGSSSKYDDYYSESSSPYGHGSSSNYYDDYSSGYDSSSKYDDYYSESSSPYGYDSSSNYYNDYSSGYDSSPIYSDDYSSEYNSSSKYYDDDSSGFGSNSTYFDYSSEYESYSNYYDQDDAEYEEYSNESGESSSEESGEAVPPSEESGNSTCNCGWVNKGRIVGGKQTKKNEYPFMASLEEDGSHLCGSTILTERHVLTAGHCTFNRTMKRLSVRVGVHNLRKALFMGEGSVHRLKKIINQFDGESTINDIALLVLKTSIKFDQNVGPACLPSKKVDLEGQKIRALGWGRMVHQGPTSYILREVDLEVISFEKCEQLWKEKFLHPFEGTNLCTFEVNKDTCQGDSGGPLVWLNPSTNRYTIVALVSFGGDCAKDLPGVNTDVAAYLDWIKTGIAGSSKGIYACQKE